jgi:REP element-mobilizing transposase RayT
MSDDPERHRRRSIRLADWDYAGAGAYFVTVCTHKRLCLFGEVVDGEMRLNEWGEIVQEEWFQTAVVRPYVVLHPDEFVVMPNHVHGIIWIADRRGDPTGRPYAGRPRGPISGSLGAIIAQYKSIVTKRINARRDAPGVPVWQRNYYEHIIRDEEELGHIHEYIRTNPACWQTDENNPNLSSSQGVRQG